MYKLVIPPNQSGYSVEVGQETISTKLDGGASRFRVDILNASSNVNCSWTVGPDNYEYLRRFYLVNVKNGNEPFLIDLILDSAIPTQYVARFIPGTWGLTGQQGHTYTVGCQLEIEAIEHDYDYDETLIMLISEYGSEQAAYEVLNLLDKLVNHDLPEINYHG